MSTATTEIQVKVSPELKDQANEVLKSMHLNMSEAIRLFLGQVVLTQSIPFGISIPSEKSQKAIDKAVKNQDLHEVKTAKKLIQELNT